MNIMICCFLLFVCECEQPDDHNSLVEINLNAEQYVVDSYIIISMTNTGDDDVYLFGCEKGSNIDVFFEQFLKADWQRCGSIGTWCEISYKHYIHLRPHTSTSRYTYADEDMFRQDGLYRLYIYYGYSPENNTTEKAFSPPFNILLTP